MARYKIKKIPPQAKKRFPIWLLLAGGALVLIAALALWRPGGSNPPPIEVTGASKIRVDQEKIDYGNVQLGTLIRTEVLVTNVGDQPLQFTEAPYIELLEGC